MLREQGSLAPVNAFPSPSIFYDQRQFMIACGQYLGTRPGLNDESMMWRKLVLEEYNELAQAWRDFIVTNSANHLADVAKESIDLIYVISGLLNNLGIDADAIWDAVHASNMTKVDPDTGEVRRRSDGKILKPDGWTPPDILGLITKR